MSPGPDRGGGGQTFSVTRTPTRTVARFSRGDGRRSRRRTMTLVASFWSLPLRNRGQDVSSATYAALVYATGGLRFDDEPLANARRGGLPRLMAYGERAVTTDPSSNVTGVLTGSSVSTVVVSTTAAAVWSYQPSWKPWQVMDQIYQTAVADSASRSADFSLTRPRPARKRVSLCRAVSSVCTACQPALTCDRWTKDPIALRHLPFRSFLRGATPVPAMTQWDPPNSLGQCSTSQQRSYFESRGANRAASYCPFGGRAGRPGLAAQAWVGPTPETDPCPSCPIFEDPEEEEGERLSSGSGTGRWRLLLEIDRGFQGELTDPTLVVNDTFYSLPLGLLKAGDKRVVPISGIKLQANHDVTLQFTVDKTRSAMSTIVVSQ